MTSQRRRILYPFSVAVVIAALGYCLYPSLQREACARSLALSEDAKDRSDLLRRALDRDSEAWDDMIADFAERDPLVLFDRRHRLIMVHDPVAGTIRESSKKPGTSWHRTASGDLIDIPVGPAHLAGVIRTIYSERCHGEPVVFSDLICVECTDERAVYVFRCAEGSHYCNTPFYAIDMRFKQTSAGSWQSGGGKIPVTDDLIAGWRKAGTWPVGWPRTLAGP